MNQKRPIKIGIILKGFDKRESTALRYLILQQNTLQQSIEFQLLPVPAEKNPMDDLVSEQIIQKCSEVRNKIREYKTSYYNWLKNEKKCGDIQNELDGIILISMAKFQDRFYFSHLDKWVLLSLGHWEKYMAPPSVIEFILILLIEASVDFACGKIIKRHYCTKSCAFDFTANLEEARFKSLIGYLCPECIETINASCSANFTYDVKKLLALDWLGNTSEPSNYALISKKLGYDLFHTKGIKPDFWERFNLLFEEKLFDNLFKILASIAILALSVWLGLKTVT
jgi:hypothetical protein